MARRMSVDDMRDEYTQTFDDKTWLKEHYAISKDPTKPSLRARVVPLLHKVIDKAQPKGRVLDIGTGGSLLSVMAVSKFADEIVLTGFLENERIEMNKWLTKDASAFAWTDWCDLQAKCEAGISGAEVEERIRRKVTGVWPCDVHECNPLYLHKTERFDVITMVAVMEPACPTEEDYMQAVKNIASLVKPGGQVIVCAAYDADRYFVGGKQYDLLRVSTQFVQSAYENAGFKDVQFELLELSVNDTLLRIGGVYCMHAIRI